MTPDDPKTLRAAFGSFMTGVTVVTTTDDEGCNFGFTANSFTSVSIDPPLILVCPGKFLSSFDTFQTCTHFCINILAQDQQDIANIFASYKGDRFAKVDWTPDENGMPMLSHAIARFSCKTFDRHAAGDHVILVGQVTDFDHTVGRGLGYSYGRFFSLDMERDASTPQNAPHHVAGAIVDKNNALLLTQTGDTWSFPQVIVEDGQSARSAVDTMLSKMGLAMKSGKAFSIFTDTATGTRFTYLHANGSAAHSDTGEWIPVTDVAHLQFANPTHKTMLDRYLIERATGHFSLYVGDQTHGDIHPIDERS